MSHSILLYPFGGKTRESLICISALNELRKEWDVIGSIEDPLCYIGSGSAIREDVFISEGTLVGPGSNIVSNISIRVVVAENPARVLTERGPQ